MIRHFRSLALLLHFASTGLVSASLFAQEASPSKATQGSATQGYCATQAPAESSDMKVLFNGKDLAGWDGDPNLWSVRDGVIHGETTEQHPASGNTFNLGRQGGGF